MSLKHLHEFLIKEGESKKTFGDLLITEDSIEFLNTEGVDLAIKANKIKGSNNAIRYQMWGNNMIVFDVFLGGMKVQQTIKNLEKFSDCDILPNYLNRPGITIRYSYKKELTPGKYEIGPYFSAKNPAQTINVEVGCETIGDLAKAINESVNEIFNDFKKVRIIASWDYSKASTIESYIKKEVKTIYSNLIDLFLNKGKMDPKDIDDNLSVILLASSLEENPEEIEKFNSLPEKSRKELLSGWGSILKEGDFTLSSQKVSAIKKYLSLNKAWDLI